MAVPGRGLGRGRKTCVYRRSRRHGYGSTGAEARDWQSEPTPRPGRARYPFCKPIKQSLVRSSPPPPTRPVSCVTNRGTAARRRRETSDLAYRVVIAPVTTLSASRVIETRMRARAGRGHTTFPPPASFCSLSLDLSGRAKQGSPPSSSRNQIPSPPTPQLMELTTTARSPGAKPADPTHSPRRRDIWQLPGRNGEWGGEGGQLSQEGRAATRSPPLFCSDGGVGRDGEGGRTADITPFAAAEGTR